MHTILGANGVIGTELSRALADQGEPVRQVSRSPRPVSPDDEIVSADLLDPGATADAVAGSTVAYLVAGLKYDTDTWREQWPRIMQNTIDACARHRVRLAFFDNVYAYGRVAGVMTEDTPFNPTSRKGEVRARIATTLLDAMRADELEAMIVRAADFYGPGAVSSFTHVTVFERLRAGRKPQWLGNARAAHTFTFTPDAGRALATLAATPTA
jgi:nucleoside-diphosphate-sugar epimerase